MISDEFKEFNPADGFNFHNVIKEAYELYPRIIGTGALTVMLYAMVSGIVNLMIEQITGFNLLSVAFMEDLQQTKKPELMVEKTIDFYRNNMNVTLLTRFSTEIIMLLSFPLAGGFMLACRELEEKGMTNLSTVFKAFKSYYWTRLIVLAVLYFILSKIGLMLFLIPGIYIWAAAVLACPFVMFTDSNGIQALQKSVRVVNKKWLTVFNILLFSSVIGLSGYLLCGIGRVFTYPFVLTAIYIMYKKLVGFGAIDGSENQ